MTDRAQSVLAEDPRDFWLEHRYRDVGGSSDEPHAMHWIADGALLDLQLP